MISEGEAPKGNHVCPWWFAYTFDNALRRLVHSPAALLSPYVKGGMSVVDVGCGMGYFSIGMALLVGPGGRVHAVDLQEKMLEITMKRSRRAGVEGRVIPHRCGPESLGLDVAVDFALLFWMVHEVPDAARLFREIFSLLSPGGRLLYTEPRFHVGRDLFQQLLGTALGEGFENESVPPVRFSRSVLMKKPPQAKGEGG